jgi:hypothetical protein
MYYKILNRFMMCKLHIIYNYKIYSIVKKLKDIVIIINN